MKKVLIGFISGFVATLVFHQIAVAVVAAVGIAPFSPWNMAAAPPLGIPAVISLSFWGGVWGILFIFIHHSFGTGARYYTLAFLFGAIFPSLLALLIISPLKGGPVFAGGDPGILLGAFLVNGVWGAATGFLIKLIEGRRTALDSSSH